MRRRSARHAFRAALTAFLVVAGAATVEGQNAGSAGDATHQLGNSVTISEQRAKEIAVQAAKTRFGGRGVAGSPLRFDQITVRFEPAAPGGADIHASWYVRIPEEVTRREPSGRLIIVDAETGSWKSLVQE